MALYDDLIARLNDPARRLTVSDRQEAAACITQLQADIRGYNPDDAIFDDESELRPMTEADAASVLARPTSLTDGAVERERIERLEAALRSVVGTWEDPGPMGTLYQMPRAIYYAKSVLNEPVATTN